MSTPTRRAVGRVAAMRAKSAISKAPVADTTEKKGRKRGRPKATDNAAAEADDGTSPYFKSKAPSASKSKKLSPGTKLGKSFYNQDTVTLAKEMLGKVLCRRLPETGEILKGTVVETEAYPGEGDAASRSFKGVPTPASMPMFMDPGTAYVYMTYGMYHCFNISANDKGGACLLRALEVHEDYEVMQDLRNSKKKKNDTETAKSDRATKGFKRHELANGPSKLCLSFNITKDSCNKLDMNVSDDLWLESSTDEQYFQRKFEIEESRRVGIDRTPTEARYKLYRYFIKDNNSVSKAKFKDDATTGRKRKK